jgi:hypothetical protein
MKQARHLEAIRQLRDAETGKHPFPQLLSEIQPFDDSIKTRVQKGVTAPAAVLASDLHAKAAQNTISEKIRRHRDFRRSVDRENPSAALIEYAKSYHRERLETEGFIQYFRLRCEQANRDSNSDRQIASR